MGPVLGRHDPGTGESERCTSRGADQVRRLVPDARSESGAGRSAGVSYHNPRILEVRKIDWKTQHHCQRIQSVCEKNKPLSEQKKKKNIFPKKKKKKKKKKS